MAQTAASRELRAFVMTLIVMLRAGKVKECADTARKSEVFKETYRGTGASRKTPFFGGKWSAGVKKLWTRYAELDFRDKGRRYVRLATTAHTTRVLRCCRSPGERLATFTQ